MMIIKIAKIFCIFPHQIHMTIVRLTTPHISDTKFIQQQQQQQYSSQTQSSSVAKLFSSGPPLHRTERHVNQPEASTQYFYPIYITAQVRTGATCGPLGAGSPTGPLSSRNAIRPWAPPGPTGPPLAPTLVALSRRLYFKFIRVVWVISARIERLSRPIVSRSFRGRC